MDKIDKAVGQAVKDEAAVKKAVDNLLGEAEVDIKVSIQPRQPREWSTFFVFSGIDARGGKKIIDDIIRSKGWSGHFEGVNIIKWKDGTEFVSVASDWLEGKQSYLRKLEKIVRGKFPDFPEAIDIEDRLYGDEEDEETEEVTNQIIDLAQDIESRTLELTPENLAEIVKLVNSGKSVHVGEEEGDEVAELQWVLPLSSLKKAGIDYSSIHDDSYEHNNDRGPYVYYSDSEIVIVDKKGLRALATPNDNED